MRTLQLVSLFFLFCLYGCKNQSIENAFDQSVILQNVDSTLRINITDEVSCTDHIIRYFNDNEHEYLAIEGKQKLLISIYNLYNGEHVKTVVPGVQGPNGLGARMFGFDIVNFDTIFISTRGLCDNIFIIDSSATLIKKIDFDIYKQPYLPIAFLLSNRGYSTNYNGNRVALSNVFRAKEEYWKKLSDYNIGYCFDLQTNERYFYPLKHPDLSCVKEEVVCSEGNFIENGNKVILSYPLGHSVFVSTNGEPWVCYNLKSRYVEKAMHDSYGTEMIETIRKEVDSPRYLALVYDKYRNVYYRFVYLGLDPEPDDDLSMLAEFHRNVSIMVIDEDFNVIGETLLPNKTYNANMFFINQAGLWISTNNPENPHFEEDVMNFELFKIVR